MDNTINGRTPEEIKKGLECCAKPDNPVLNKCEFCVYGAVPGCENALKYDAIALIQQLESAQPKWISVEERLPETQDYEGEPIEYIVHVDGAELATFAIFDGERFIPSEFPGFIEKRMFAGPITHWMPLPAPPKEKER